MFEVARKDCGMGALNNSVKAIRKPKLPRGRERRLQAGEEDLLLAYCDAQENASLRAFIILAIETAIRRGEIADLRWADVDLNSRLAYLHETKNGTCRVVTLQKTVKARSNVLMLDSSQMRAFLVLPALGAAGEARAWWTKLGRR